MAPLLAEGVELGEGLKLGVRQEGLWRWESLGGGDRLVRSASLPPGRYELHVLGGDHDEVVVPFEIRSGEETQAISERHR